MIKKLSPKDYCIPKLKNKFRCFFKAFIIIKTVTVRM